MKRQTHNAKPFTGLIFKIQVLHWTSIQLVQLTGSKHWKSSRASKIWTFG